MNHNRIDRLSQTLDDTNLQSRRGVLAALGIAVLGAFAGVDTNAASAKRKTGHQGNAKRKKHGRNRGQRHSQGSPGAGATTPPQNGAGGGGCTSDDQAVTCAGKCSTVKDNCGRDVNCGNTCSGVETCGGGGTSNACGCTSQPQSVTCSGRCGMETDNCGHAVDCGTCPGGGCFVAGTRVRIADGSDKPIELVEPGDRVLGRGGKINQVRSILYPMLGDRPLYSLNRGTAFVTASHSFLTTDGWKAIDPDAARVEVPGLDIERLTVGDVLLSVTSSEQVQEHEIPLQSLDGRPADAATQLYNLDVDGDDTYVANGLVVHNKYR